MQINVRVLVPVLLIVTFAVTAQQTVQDSVIATQLDEVVVTGQIEPQSIKKSVFNVRVISAEDIKRQAGNNLADVLNQYLNITIQPQSGEGRSTVSMFGLDSQYLKVLVDNVPLVSDTGLGNNIDLTQINLDDIQQIEIIEGAMGVTHGANAVSGIINIITKKTTKNKWEITATVQEETVGDEYSPLYDEGRHIQALRVAHSINNNWYVAIGANRNDFEGYMGEFGGKEFTNNPNNPEQERGYSWLPKEQIFTNTLLRYQKGNTRVFYRFEYFDEKIDFYNAITNTELQDDNVTQLIFANDRRYFTEKFYHHLNAVGKVLGLDYNASISHQKQQRDVEQFKYYIQTDTESGNAEQPYQETEVLYSTGTLSNFFKKEGFDFQLGYELVNTYGYSSALTGNFNDPDQGDIDLKKRLENYDVFTAAEISVTEKFMVRPGFRYSFQSKFDDQWAASMGFRYLLGKGLETRLSYGRSYRTPNYEELYSYFVDSNHNLQGNPDLTPESGHSIEASIKKQTFFQSGLQLSNAFTAGFISIDDRIELAVTATTPSLQYRYINIDSYKMWNLATTHQLVYKNIQAKLGVSVLGISRAINTGLVASDDEYLVNYQFNANIGYTVPKWNTLLSLYYKHNGKQQQYVQDSSLNDPQFILSEIESFGLMDASVRQSFFKNKFDVTLGARNLLDVVNIQSSVASGGTHTAGNTNILMGYGRSYFLKLTYNLNF
ncbi:TonB-dependent receptor [Flavobacterium salilacus subsp. salilacus]|uniref:TonB-dependent receptor plug domain-containing protein n=1 Tax=Flavobacterium TaxID=237 RepID=UPI001074C74D|nr:MULTISPECIES: TonB-dependent receptor [Flavobacterium]KAF2519048.1 TonB-dependent receptor [Flavobacterium salilacus subsp. salilacus]MBE1614787.1 TonB-dependent receptor [Flavobacterium sp. SaA2.13]